MNSNTPCWNKNCNILITCSCCIPVHGSSTCRFLHASEWTARCYPHRHGIAQVRNQRPPLIRRSLEYNSIAAGSHEAPATLLQPVWWICMDEWIIFHPLVLVYFRGHCLLRRTRSHGLPVWYSCSLFLSCTSLCWLQTALQARAKPPPCRRVPIACTTRRTVVAGRDARNYQVASSRAKVVQPTPRRVSMNVTTDFEMMDMACRCRIVSAIVSSGRFPAWLTGRWPVADKHIFAIWILFSTCDGSLESSSQWLHFCFNKYIFL